MPKAEFIGDVEAFMKGKECDTVVAQLNEHLRLFRMKEQEVLQRRIRLINKLPELERTLDIVKELITRAEQDEELITDFELANTVYAKAKIPPAKTVNLWLGAGVMLEYPLAEARSLLEENFGNCKKNLQTNEADQAFIKDCITITEVSIARVFNHDVEQRRKEKEAAGAS